MSGLLEVIVRHGADAERAEAGGADRRSRPAPLGSSPWWLLLAHLQSMDADASPKVSVNASSAVSTTSPRTV